MQSRFDQVSLILLKVGSFEILPAGLMKKLQRGNNFQFHLGGGGRGAQNWFFQVSVYIQCMYICHMRGVSTIATTDLLFVKPR